MSERRQHDDSGARIFVAGGVICAAIVAGIVVRDVLSRFMRDGRLAEGIGWVVFGLTLLAAEFIFRFPEKAGFLRFLSALADGLDFRYRLALIGLVAVLCGILFAMGII
ncbi:MAG TPA: hypothetical protein VGM05_04480 [Planctomycetaceae bacterium]|jgi:hypothetical protein